MDDADLWQGVKMMAGAAAGAMLLWGLTVRCWDVILRLQPTFSRDPDEKRDEARYYAGCGILMASVGLTVFFVSGVISVVRSFL
jgi:hypothetical protein